MTAHLYRLEEKVNELYALEEEILSEEALELAVYEACILLEHLGFETPETFSVKDVILTMDQVLESRFVMVEGEITRAFGAAFRKLGGAIKGAVRSKTPTVLYHKQELEKHKKAMQDIQSNPKSAFDKKAHAKWRTHSAELNRHWGHIDPKNWEIHKAHIGTDGNHEPGSEQERKQAFRGNNPVIAGLLHKRGVERRDAALAGKAPAVPAGSKQEHPTTHISTGEVKKAISKRYGKKTGIHLPAEQLASRT